MQQIQRSNSNMQDSERKPELSLGIISASDHGNRDDPLNEQKNNFQNGQQGSVFNNGKPLSQTNRQRMSNGLIQITQNNFNNNSQYNNSFDKELLRNDVEQEAGINKNMKIDIDNISLKDKTITSQQQREQQQLLNNNDNKSVRSQQVGSNSTNVDKAIELTPQQREKEQEKQIREIAKKDYSQHISKWVGFIMVLWSLGMAIFCTVAYILIRAELPRGYYLVKQNWEYSPIINIRPSSIGCDEYLTLYTYPGTVDGCDCRSSLSVVYSQKVFDQTCDSQQLKNGCVQINSIPSQDFTFWKNNSQLFQLCVERLNGFSFLSSNCDSAGFKACGVPNGQKSGINMFCVPISQPCPLNSIVFGNTSPDYTYEQIYNTGNGLLFVSRQSTQNMPLALSLISPGDHACKDYKNYHYVNDDNDQFILLRNRTYLCSLEQTDSRFNPLLTIPSNDLLMANSYYNKISALPNYSTQPNHNYVLNTRSYVPWYQLSDCKNIHLPLFLDLDTKTDFLHTLWIATLADLWAVFLFFGIVATALRLKKHWKVTNCWILPAWILLIAQLGLSGYCFYLSMNLNKKINKMRSDKCSDDQTNQLITTFSNDFSNTYFLVWIILLCCSIILIILTLLFVKVIFAIIKRVKVITEKVKEADKKSQGECTDGLLQDGQLEDKQNEKLSNHDPLPVNDGGYSNTYNIFNQNEENFNTPAPAPAPAVLNILALRQPKIIQRPVIQDTPELDEFGNPKRTDMFVIEQKEPDPEELKQEKLFIEDAREKFLANYKQEQEQKKNVVIIDEEEGELSDHDSWEFDDINKYVRQHRKIEPIVSNRTGGGYALSKGKPQVANYKFQQRHQRQAKEGAVNLESSEFNQPFSDLNQTDINKLQQSQIVQDDQPMDGN